MESTPFDAQAKEAALQAEAAEWDTSTPIDAEPGDVPVIDIAEYLATNDQDASSSVASSVAERLRDACETVGFWQLTGHGIDAELIRRTFEANAAFHALPLEVKEQVAMDAPGRPLGGVGYLPVGHRKLPARSTGNRNEAVIIKSGRGIGANDNPWLSEDEAPGFRETVEAYQAAVVDLTLRLLPLYATALGVDADFFAEAFDPPFGRLRLTHYPAQQPEEVADTAGTDVEQQSRQPQSVVADAAGTDVERQSRQHYGIQPHVDTTFFTLLLQDSPGLTTFHTPKQQWLNVPVVENAFVVNSGELLKQWTNDRFLSVRHFAYVRSFESSRYSIPFFVNADRDYVMECIPTCCGDGVPAKYPPISYNQSQGVVQGE